MSNRSSRRRRPEAARPRALVSIAIPLPGGRLGLYIGDEIRESDPPAVREGLARRRLLATEGRCPCGAEVPFDPAIIAPGIVSAAVVHEADCPAAEANLSAALRTGRRAA
jgi:hypothetical protein